MTDPDMFHHHSEICEAMHQILLMENRWLKNTGKPPDEALLWLKRTKSAELSASLDAIRAVTSARPTPAVRASAAKAQQTILKAMLVDRENEKLLLKAITPPAPPKTASRPPAAQFQRAYANTP